MKRSLYKGIEVKEVLKFFSDILYIKEVISVDEYDAIMDCCCGDDLDDVFESIMLDSYFDYKRGGKVWELKNGQKLNI